MIEFNFEYDFELGIEENYKSWIKEICTSEDFTSKNINYIFCDDAYLLKINQQYLQHNYLTDIITFDYVKGKEISGDLFISIDRVKENAQEFKVSFANELKRVMAHGLLHLIGFSDKTEAEKQIMRLKEEEKIKMFHVEP